MSSTTTSTDPAEIAIQEFARIASVDEGLAHFFLQDYDYDLQRGLNAYFRQMQREVTSTVVNTSQDMEVDGIIATIDTASSSLAREPVNDEFPPEILCVTYNVDGLDQGNLITRFKAVCNIIAKINPEIICLQEVVMAHMSLINELFTQMYHVVKPPEDGMPYFTVTMVSKNFICRSKEVISYNNTTMGRTMTIFEGQLNKLRLVVINSHLESMKDYSEPRKAQFRECIKKMEEHMDKNTLVIFAGDLNIRDAEVPAMNPQIKDAWIAAGSNNEMRYTWDNMKNSNKNLPKNVRCRFDRVYFNGPYKKLDFYLVGTQQIQKVFRYPSDHFGVVCKFFNPVDQ